MNWRVAFGALLLCCSPAVARSPEMTLTSDAATPSALPGVQKLGANAFFYRPARASNSPRPLIILFHGAGMSARNFLDGARSEADRCGCLLLSIQSSGPTWDTIGLVSAASKNGRATRDQLFGADTGRVEQALSIALKAADADRRAVILAGFSDGASYALSLGLANPAIVSGIIAFAPGFHLEPAAINPKQRLFIAHSPTDKILSFERTRDDTVASLKKAGFDLSFRQFDGGHRVDKALLSDGVDYVLGRSAAAD
jgi:phospholipase/carboxylesterase